eukprot:c6280_g1_i1.p1 GENE.c6280_g1_i1~~c6280_g1_i1.p1  ORF type:complete len:644 (-),score=181.36 c6280_g1_i1:91-1971(-)
MPKPFLRLFRSKKTSKNPLPLTAEAVPSTPARQPATPTPPPFPPIEIPPSNVSITHILDLYAAYATTNGKFEPNRVLSRSQFSLRLKGFGVGAANANALGKILDVYSDKTIDFFQFRTAFEFGAIAEHSTDVERVNSVMLALVHPLVCIGSIQDDSGSTFVRTTALVDFLECSCGFDRMDADFLAHVVGRDSERDGMISTVRFVQAELSGVIPCSKEQVSEITTAIRTFQTFADPANRFLISDLHRMFEHIPFKTQSDFELLSRIITYRSSGLCRFPEFRNAMKMGLLPTDMLDKTFPSKILELIEFCKTSFINVAGTSHTISCSKLTSFLSDPISRSRIISTIADHNHDHRIDLVDFSNVLLHGLMGDRFDREGGHTTRTLEEAESSTFSTDEHSMTGALGNSGTDTVTSEVTVTSTTVTGTTDTTTTATHILQENAPQSRFWNRLEDDLTTHSELTTQSISSRNTSSTSSSPPSPSKIQSVPEPSADMWPISTPYVSHPIHDITVQLELDSTVVFEKDESDQQVVPVDDLEVFQMWVHETSGWLGMFTRRWLVVVPGLLFTFDHIRVQENNWKPLTVLTLNKQTKISVECDAIKIHSTFASTQLLLQSITEAQSIAKRLEPYCI